MTADDILDLMPIVAHHTWTVYAGGAIRNQAIQCPVCALVAEISDGAIYAGLTAHTVMRTLFRGARCDRPSERVRRIATSEMIHAADDPAAPYRAALVAALDMPVGS